MTLDHVIVGFCCFIAGFIVCALIYDKPLPPDDVEELLEKKGKGPQ